MGDLFIAGTWTTGAVTVAARSSAPPTAPTSAPSPRRAMPTPVRRSLLPGRLRHRPVAGDPARDRGALLARVADLLGTRRRRDRRAESLDTGKRYVESGMTSPMSSRSSATTPPSPAPTWGGSSTPAGRASPPPWSGADRGLLAHHPVELPAAAGLVGRSRPASPPATPSSSNPPRSPRTIHHPPGPPARGGRTARGRGQPRPRHRRRLRRAAVPDPRVDLVSFTGSLAVGRHPMAAAAPTVKRVALEPAEEPQYRLRRRRSRHRRRPRLTAVFLHSGQVCSRRVRASSSRSRRGLRRRDRPPGGQDPARGPFDESAQSGPLTSAGHLAKVEACVAAAWPRRPAAVRGARPSGSAYEKGFYHCHGAGPVPQRHVRGPGRVLRAGADRRDLHRRDPALAEDAAVALANDTIYGLAGAVWTQTAGRGERVARDCAWARCGSTTTTPTCRRRNGGGYKRSGSGEPATSGSGGVPGDQARVAQPRPGPSGWFS